MKTRPIPKSHPVDYNAEARALWQRFGIDPGTTSNKWSHMDPIWKCPVGGGTIYIGNQTAAQNKDKLFERRITHVVNCTDDIPNYHKGELIYMNFPITDWTYSGKCKTNEGIRAFTQPLWDFIDPVLARGESVLIHCLAGAHRAGTTGCSCLIHYAGMDAATATRSAKAMRSIIDPIYDFADFLQRLEKAEREKKK